MSTQKIKYFILIFLCLSLSNCHDKKAKILIIGDSISMGYTPFVKKALKEGATVHHNRGNAQHTGIGLKKIEEWLKAEQWDIIQFNWGLWDICYRNNTLKFPNNKDKIKGKITVDLGDYESNLNSLVRTIRKNSNAKLVFVTTTYVPPQNKGRFAKDVIRYNEVAKKIMKKHKVAINDLYKASSSIHKKHGKTSTDVHYTKEGYEKLAAVVADHLKEIIKISVKDTLSTD